MGQTASGAFDGSGVGVFPGGASERTVICSYDFAVHGGAVSSIAIGRIPSGSYIVGGFMLIETAVVGAGATVGIDSEATSDIVTAAAVAGAPWSTTGKKAINPKVNTPETTSVTLTADRNINLTITAAVLTAGKLKLFLMVQNAL
mgnify:CR=1 FL=1